VIGVLAIPAVAERFDRTRATVIGCGLLGSIGALGLLLTPSFVLLLSIPIVLVGLGVGGLSSLIRSIPVELDDIGPALTGTAIGLVYAVGEIGGFLGPVLIGALRDTTGSFTAGIALCVIAALVATGAGVAMSDPDRSG
jgi:cyanate permease